MLACAKWPDDYAEQFWENYPRRVAKKAAVRALDKIRRANEVPFEVLLSAVKLYARSMRGKDMQFVKHPATWLNGGCWDDDPDALLAGSPRQSYAPRGVFKAPPPPPKPSDAEINEQFARLGLQHLRRK